MSERPHGQAKSQLIIHQLINSSTHLHGQAKLQLILLNGAEKQQAHNELFAQLQGFSAQNKKELATALRGVELLKGPNGDPDPKLLALTKLHMLGEVLASLFERLHVRDTTGAEREEAMWGLLDGFRDAVRPHPRYMTVT